MKRPIVTCLGVLGALAATALAPDAKSDTFPAMGGQAWLPSEATCFGVASFSNGVRNTSCSGNRSWLVPLTLRWTGNTTFRASSTFQSGVLGAIPQCRFVLRSQSDANVSLGNLTTIQGTNINLGQVNVSSDSTTGQIDCILGPTPSFALTQVKWTTP